MLARLQEGSAPMAASAAGAAAPPPSKVERGGVGDRARVCVRRTAAALGRAPLHAFFALTLLDLLALNFPGLQPSLTRFLGVLLVLTWALLGRRDFDASRLLRWRGLFALAALAMMTRAESALAMTTAGALTVGAAGLLLRSGTEEGARLRMLARTAATASAMYVAATALYLAEPGTMRTLQRLALAWSAWMGDHLLGHPLQLGPSPLGFWVLLSFACFLAARFLVVEWRPLPFAGGMALLAAVHVTYVLGIDVLPDTVRTRAGMTIAPLYAFALGVVPVALLVSLPGRQSGGAAPRRFPSLCYAGAAAAALAVALVSPLVRSRETPKIVFYGVNEGRILDWKKPEFGRYGPYSHGMFGLLLDYLKADGFEVEVLNERIRPEHLAGRDALVTINVNTDWTDEELRTVWGFVRDGGGLFVLGDHTDVEGSRASQNALIAPTGIEFLFDGAVPSPGRGWSDCDLFAHGAHAGIAEPWRLGLGVGASLDVSRGAAIPIASSRFGLSDLGDRSAVDRALLGDYQYQLGEQLGDIVLAAWMPYGKGKFVVFGDTSSFQNGSLVDVYLPFVRQTFAWGSGSTVVDLGGGRRVAIFAATALALVALRLGRGSVETAIVLAALFFASWFATGRAQAALLDRPPPSHPVAFIDLSHGALVDRDSDAKNSVAGLIQNLQRNGYAPEMLRALDADELGRGQVLLSIAPTISYDEEDIEMLRGFMEEGGLLVLAAGYLQKEPFDGLLAAFDLDVESAPVGPIPLRREPGHPRLGVEYVEAWPVTVGRAQPQDAGVAVAAPTAVGSGELPLGDARAALAPRDRGDVRVYGSFRDVPLAVVKRVGRGGLFLVGDSYFFSGKNLEDASGHSLPNIHLLKQLLDDHRRWSEEP